MTMPHEIMVRSHPQRPIPESVSSAAIERENGGIFLIMMGQRQLISKAVLSLTLHKNPIHTSEAEQVISRREEKRIQSGSSSIIHTFS